MKFLTNVKKISTALAKYKADVDTLEKLYKLECQKVKSEAEKMKGQWTDTYISKYITEHNQDATYKARLQGARAEAEPIVLYNLEMLQKSLDNYFNAPIKPDFANKIMTIKLSGLQLSDLEFKVLQSSATSYMECRLLNQLAESRTENASVVDIGNVGGLHSKETSINNPYTRLEVPNMDNIYRRFADYKRAAETLLSQYSGKNAEMSHLLDKDVPQYISVCADSYFKSGYEEKFTKVMEQAAAILPESKIKRQLTENDKKLIDLLIDSNYPSLAKGRAKELAEADPGIRDLLLLDERYKDVIE